MRKHQFVFITAFAAAVSFLSSCNTDGYKTTETGLKYKIIKDEEGETAKIGDIVQMNVKYSNAKDSVLFNSFTQPQPITMELPASQFKGSFEEALTLLSTGDSAQFLIPSDSIFRKEMGAARPPFIDSASYLTFVVKIIKTEKKEDYTKRAEKERAERSVKQKTIDEELIAAYLKEKAITATKSETGIYTQVLKQGNGPLPVRGDTVKVQYTGRTLDGKVFDSSRKEDGGQGSVFEFILGVTPIIQGWQEGVASLKQGSRALLVIPSSLAYGEQSTPSFGPNSVLTFDVEIVKVVKPKN